MNNRYLVDRFEARLIETRKRLARLDVLELRGHEPVLLTARVGVGRSIEADEIVRGIADIVDAHRVVQVGSERLTVVGQVDGYLTCDNVVGPAKARDCLKVRVVDGLETQRGVVDVERLHVEYEHFGVVNCLKPDATLAIEICRSFGRSKVRLDGDIVPIWLQCRRYSPFRFFYFQIFMLLLDFSYILLIFFAYPVHWLS